MGFETKEATSADEEGSKSQMHSKRIDMMKESWNNKINDGIGQYIQVEIDNECGYKKNI